jgi:hypothetical protein
MVLSGLAAAQQNDSLKEKIAAAEQTARANQQALRQYAWSQEEKISVNGEVKAVRLSDCQYGPDGKPQCTSGGAPSAQLSPEMQDFAQKAKDVLALYLPPREDLIEKAYQAGNASLAPPPGANQVRLIFKNYALATDQMTFDFAMSIKKLSNLAINSYVGSPTDPISMTVVFEPLPDGTNRPTNIVVEAPSKGVKVTIADNVYRKIK